MTKLASRTNKLTSVLAFEEMPEYGVCRENVTVVFQTGMDVGAAVVANLTGGSAVATADATNTGNGTFGTITVVDPAVIGNYRVVCTSATTFNIYDPTGKQVGNGATGTAVLAKNGNGLGFTITAGGTAFIAGDAFTVAVSGTIKYVWIQASMVATLRDEVAFVVESVKDVPSMTVGDNTMTVISKGWAGVVGASLLYKDTLSAGQQATVLAKMLSRRIVNRTKV